MLDKKVPSSSVLKSFSLISNLSIILGIATFLVLSLGMIKHIISIPPTPSTKTSKHKTSTPYRKPISSEFQNLWKAPSLDLIKENKELILYGKELIANTSKYLGPKGSIRQISNGLNCQNCHLAAGTQPFGNNYGGVASTYPKIRSRSGKVVDTKGRINACFQRSLNGSPLPSGSKELNAMIAYIEWLGKDVPRGVKPKGAGLYKIPYLNRAADPKKGKRVYIAQCERCHGTNGEGKIQSDGKSYEYPPLWGSNSYNVSAGLYRIEKFAQFVKTNMPYGISYKDIVLSDEEAWDIAAYVNSQPHPNKKFKGDWTTNLVDKPLDAPFGPYADKFTEKQHKYGPYPPIQKAIQLLKNK